MARPQITVAFHCWPISYAKATRPVRLQRVNVIGLRLLNLLHLLRHILSRLHYENDLRARTAKRKDKHENAKQEHPQRPKSQYHQSCQEDHRETIPQG